jgi:hypothetical protein
VGAAPFHGFEYLSKAPASQFRICLRKRRTLTRTLRQAHEIGAYPMSLLLNGFGTDTSEAGVTNAHRNLRQHWEIRVACRRKKTTKTLTNGRTFCWLYVYTVTRSSVTSQQELALHRNAQQRHKGKSRLYRSEYITDQEVHRR